MQVGKLTRWIILIGLAIALATDVGLSQAQGPGPQGNVSLQTALSTAFTYQGRLTDGGRPANGTYDFVFKLYDDAESGSQVGSTVTMNDVTVGDGLFTVELDFGDVFDGTARWLEIGVRSGGSAGAYTTLTPRQPIAPVPYALALPGLWTQQNGTSPNLIGGYSGNSVTAGVVGATIGGGGSGDYPNLVTADYATVGGGYGNKVVATGATIGGGAYNLITTTADYATIAGGYNITVTADADYATVGGGYGNVADAWYATVGGGRFNTVLDLYATVGGGHLNTADGQNATVGGGSYNTADGWATTVGGGSCNTADAIYATVGGGYGNSAGGDYATVPGGRDNEAGSDYSFAAGRRAKANKPGCFVWADSTDEDFACSWDNQFRVRATGGATFLVQTTPNWRWVRFKVESNSLINTSTGAYLSIGGIWTNGSDRNAKENLRPVDPRAILEKVAQLPITTWNYKAQDDSIRHLGPMAQDFYAAFGLGEDDKHISTVDADGVALAAIQGLYQQNQEQAARIAQLEAENAKLQAHVDDLAARVEVLEKGRVATGNRVLFPVAGLLLVFGTWVVQRKEGWP